MQSPTATASPRGRRHRPGISLTPEEYAKAVNGYSRLPTGPGQDHVDLAEFLASGPAHTDLKLQQYLTDGFVTVYPLGVESDDTPHHTITPLPSQTLTPPANQLSPYASNTSPLPLDSDVEGDAADDRHHNTRRAVSFHDPADFLSYKNAPLQGRLVFMRGYMSSTWLKTIGAQYVMDPEFFCRHLDFRALDDTSSTFSTPALPSASWHLIELPVMTIGRCTATKAEIVTERVQQLRQQGAEALAQHHHRIAKLSSSDMAVGEAMYREYHVFDETHFAIEQRISICLQPSDRGNPSTIIIWLDSGANFRADGAPTLPWHVHLPQSCYLPTIRHKHMVALRWHLLSSTEEASAHSASYLPIDYGRSLRPSSMARDAFYSLTEVFTLAASAQTQFLNLIDAKLDRYTAAMSSPELAFGALSNLRYTKKILFRYISRTKCVLDSIRTDRVHPKWPRDDKETGSRKTSIAAESVEADFTHLLESAEALHRRSTEAISVLMSSISISESQKAIEQAQRLAKLTILAFIFVPLSFTTSLFGMNVSELEHGVGIKWWIALSVPLTAGVVALFIWDVEKSFNRVITGLCEMWTGCRRLLP